MHREGHVGAALVFYAPIGFAVAMVTNMEWALFGAMAAAGLSMLPDVDMYLPGVAHRGITHTIHFAALVGLVCGVAGVLYGAETGLASSVLLGAFAALVGMTTVVSHIAADAITPMGVDPFRTGERHSYDIVRAANPVANYLLLAVGIAVAAAAAGLANALGAT